ncbi:hypothetical protein [Microbacterium foliorum]|uniref:hypothetical protein n=1 Tax=Microbacterium foliorum TaxID=104336 RepID=UPI0009A03F85|nr:hypothetical protein [Microbacterium foliorum]AQY01613.1 hypothetical protein B2G67_09135 [Microbacterium foliorum]
MTFKFFETPPERYLQNLEQGSGTVAIPALLNTPDGTVVPGIAIIWGGRSPLVIPEHDALRVASQIAGIASRPREIAHDDEEAH